MASKSGKRRGWPFLIFVVVIIGSYVAISRRSPMPEVFATSLSMEQAEVKSREMGMPVLVFASADWCGPCTQFKRGALKDEAVTRWIRENTVPVLVEMNDRNAPPPEAERLRISSLPTLAMYRDGVEVGRLSENAPKEKVLAWLGEHSGAVADWKHANPGEEVPDVDTGTRKMPEGDGKIPMVPPAPGATPGGGPGGG